jgi:hypothetical protein
LPFGANSVESEGRFPGTGEAGDDSEAIARDVDINVLEVVLPRAPDTDAINSHNENQSF